MAKTSSSGKLEHARRVLVQRAKVAKLIEAGKKNRLDTAKAKAELTHIRKGGR